MIKVINVITDTNIGGAGKCVLNFLELYDRSKIDMEVFIPPKSLLKNEIKQRNCKYTEVNGLNDMSFNISSIAKLSKLFREKKPDIVHTHAAMSARVAAKLATNCKIIHTRHSVFEIPRKHKSFPLKQIRGGINNIFSDRIIAVSPAAEENLIDIGTSRKKITVVYNGVNKCDSLSEREISELKSKYGISSDDFVVAIIARLEEVKGHEYVLKAAKLLKDQRIKFIIAGTGSLEKILRKKAQADNLQNVIFTGFIKKIYEIENIMDLQINASYGTEATSLSLLEGMSLHKPAVVTNFGGNPFIIKENINGIVVPKKDATALANAILKLKNDHRLYSTLCKGAGEEFENKYTAKVMATGISNLYYELV